MDQAHSLRTALQDARCVLRENVSLAPLTHLRVGGPAAFFVEPHLPEAVPAVVRACKELELPLLTLGGGSNVVVADEGVPAVVMSLAQLNRQVRDRDRITAGAGVTLASLMRATRELGLSGLEVLCGIPAVVGGAVAMNAGTREGETFDRLVQLTVVDPDGEMRSVSRRELQPAYRDGRLGGALVVDATFELQRDDPAKIYARFETSLKRRNASQPVTQRSVGCVFRNPSTDVPAGRLIEEAGCKLLRRGGISVSGLHANYFVNDGAGTCSDFVALMHEVQQRVRAHAGVELEPEVKFWGP